MNTRTFCLLLSLPLTANLVYTGHVHDSDSGLVYMQQRYYDPVVGRFLRVDPVGVSGTNGGNFNRYWYANNNPSSFEDPDGRCTGSRLTDSDGLCQMGGGTTTGTSGMLEGMAANRGFQTASMEEMAEFSSDDWDAYVDSGMEGVEFNLMADTRLPSAPQWLVDGSAGFGDTLTSGFGLFDQSLTGMARGYFGADGVVDHDSAAYRRGGYAGYAVGGGAAIGGTARGAGWSVQAMRYRNAGGGGVNVFRHGQRRFGSDWHRFKLDGRWVNRPHYHRGATKSQMKKHRPWQGGW